MKLTVLGKYGPYPAVGGATSGYLLETEKASFVLDMGSGVFSRLEGKIAPEKVDCIIISHFHADHCSDLPIFGYYLQKLDKAGKIDGKIKVFCPKSDREICSEISRSKYFDVTFVEEKEYDFRGLKLRFFKTNHPETCYGVNITEATNKTDVTDKTVATNATDKTDAAGKTNAVDKTDVTRGETSFSYTGDTNVCPAAEELFKRAKVVLADGGLLERDRSENSPHLSVEKCVEYGNKWGNKLIISHICPSYDSEEIIKCAGRKGEWTIAEEGKSYDF